MEQVEQPDGTYKLAFADKVEEAVASARMGR